MMRWWITFVSIGALYLGLIAATLAYGEIGGFNALTNATNTSGYFAGDSASMVITMGTDAKQMAMVWPYADCTIDKLMCASSQAPGMGAGWAATVLTDNADDTFVATGMAVTIGGTATFATDTTGTGALKQGGSAVLQITPLTGGEPAGAVLQCSYRANCGVYWYHASNMALPTSGSSWHMGAAHETVTERNVGVPVSNNITIQGLYCWADKPPGGTTSWTFRVRRSQFSAPNTFGNSSVNCTITGTATSCADAINTEPLGGDGDVDVQVTAIGTPAAGAHGRCGFQGFF